MNQDKNPDDQSDQQLKQELQQMLLHSDPVDSVSELDFDAAQQRLLDHWLSVSQDQTSNHDSSDDSDSAQSDHGGVVVSSETVGQVRNNRWTALRWISIAAMVLGLIGLASWWWRPSTPSDPTIAENKNGNESKSSSDTIESTDLLVEDQSPPSLPNPSDRDSSLDDQRIASVAQLNNLPPRLVQIRMREADQQALQNELVQWLTSWHVADPMQRRQMESQWTTNRQFWLVWSMQSIEQMPDTDAQAAAIELISLDLGPSAKPFLERCLANRNLASAALQHWIPLASDQQLIAWLQNSKDCGEVRRVLQQLARRDSPDATLALANVASQTSCSQLLNQVDSWNPVHGQRALESVGRTNPQGQFQSAMLLAAIPDESIDQQLLSSIQRGVQILPATAVLLLRDDGQSRNTLAKVGQSPMVTSALTSARLQVQRWRRQAERIQNSISQEVCKKCEQKS